MLGLSLPNAHITASFVLDEKEYEIEQFHLSFNKTVDFKGQPESETRGGQITIVLSESADNNLYEWAKLSTKLKDVKFFFKTDLGIRILTIITTNAYCVSLTRSINATSGTHTTLIVSPEEISLNGVKHNNYWKK